MVQGLTLLCVGGGLVLGADSELSSGWTGSSDAERSCVGGTRCGERLALLTAPPPLQDRRPRPATPSQVGAGPTPLSPSCLSVSSRHVTGYVDCCTAQCKVSVSCGGHWRQLHICCRGPLIFHFISLLIGGMGSSNS